MSIFDRFRPQRSTDALSWIGVYSATQERMVAAIGHARPGAKPAVELAPVFDAPDPTLPLLAWQRSLKKPVQATVVLNSVDYRIVPLDIPPVPPEERKSALRWQLKDQVDFDPEGASLDCLLIPGPTATAEPRQLFVVATEARTVQAWADRYRQARLPLAAVDIPELAMRNLSVLAAGTEAHAFVHLGLKSTRLALVWQRELCSFRQFGVSAFKLADADEETRFGLIERMALEIQRSTDAFSRQFHGADLRTVWFSAVREADAVSQQLSLLLPQQVEPFRVEEHVDLAGRPSVVDADRGLDFTFAIGAALRGQLH
jgi:MSHA biogenesis protein MshI